LAKVIAAVVDSPYTAGKTFEVRRDESSVIVGKRDKQDVLKLFKYLVEDADRAVTGHIFQH
jgi:hypothetical protein